VLGHALDRKAIHGGKAKHDTIDAPKIAMRLRRGMLPQASVYPEEMRATRDLLRRNSSPTSRRPTVRTTCPRLGRRAPTKRTATGSPHGFPIRPCTSVWQSTSP
jgi:hypothetical protein